MKVKCAYYSSFLVCTELWKSLPRCFGRSPNYFISQPTLPKYSCSFKHDKPNCVIDKNSMLRNLPLAQAFVQSLTQEIRYIVQFGMENPPNKQKITIRSKTARAKLWLFNKKMVAYSALTSMVSPLAAFSMAVRLVRSITSPTN